MALIIKTKNKQQEKVVRAFLEENGIDFYTKVEEDAAPYIIRTKKALSPKEKKILQNIEQSVEFINKYKKGKVKVKAKSINQLLNEL